jgi:hypothetical protein
MKKTLPRLSLARETLRRLDPAVLPQAGGGVRAVTIKTLTEQTTDATGCYICPQYPITTANA